MPQVMLTVLLMASVTNRARGCVRRPNGSARGAASHQPITNPATGRTTVYVEISTVGCIEGVATCQRLAPPCTRPGSVKSQGLLPVALGPPESLPALPLGDIADQLLARCGRREVPADQVGDAVITPVGRGQAGPPRPRLAGT